MAVLPLYQQALQRLAKKFETNSLACRIPSMKECGIQTVYPYDGSVDSEKFIHFLEEKLLPKMTKADVIIMDNCSIHHSKLVKARLQELSIEVLYMPPSPPNLIRLRKLLGLQ